MYSNAPPGTIPIGDRGISADIYDNNVRPPISLPGNGPGVTRLGDTGTGHGCWPPRANIQASPDVYANNIAIHRQGDGWAEHCCPPIPECHGGSLASGSSSVYINNKQCGRIGDPITCGSTVATGSLTVYVGG